MTIKQNVTSGRWAVAMVGWSGWHRTAAIGDGITTARSALLTRCETQEEATSLAAALNAEQPAVRAGSNDVPVYKAVPYRKLDYLGKQAVQRHQTRDCDRNIIHM